MYHGLKVRVRFNTEVSSMLYRNVEEIHYNYPTREPTSRIAFESNVHGTGCTWPISEIAEMEVTEEIEEAPEFASVDKEEIV